MDLNVFPGAPVTSGDDVIEQGFVRWTPGGSGVFLEAGKRNAPIGVESIDPTDMYQYSHGLLFSFATPSNLTGVFVGWEGADLMVMGWVTNDWDVASATGQYAPGARVQYGGDAAWVGLATTYGPMDADEPLLMADVDAGWVAGRLSLFGEANLGVKDGENSVGGLLKANYVLVGSTSATLRVDYLDRPFDGIEQMSGTVAVLWAFTEGFGGLVEYRTDKPMADGADLVHTGALELTASF